MKTLSNTHHSPILPGNYAVQTKSDTLPEENLEVEFGLNGWQKFTGYFKSPYLVFDLMLLSPFIIIGLIILIIIIVTIVIFVKKQKKQKN